MTSFNQSKQIKVKTMKKIYKNAFEKERRDFLKILASAGITKQLLRASPLLWGVMASRLAEAQTGPNKLMTVYVPNGCMPERFFPSPGALPGTWPTSLPMSLPYNGVKTQCNFLRIAHASGGHGVMDVILNKTTGAESSFDVNIGMAKGGSLPFQFINLGVMGAGTLTRAQGTTEWNGPLVPPELSPYNAFRRIFGGSSSSSTTSGGANPHQLIVDLHKPAITALRNKLGTYEKTRLDSHLSAISAYEARFGNSSSSSSSTSGTCASGTGPTQYPLTAENFGQQARDMANIAALALSCNLTASVCLQLGSDDGLFQLPQFYSDTYHNSIHGTAFNQYVPWNNTRGHLSELSANVITELTNKNVINNTIFMEISDMGHGDQHTMNDVPIILAGGNGRIQRNVANAANNNVNTRNLMATVGAALGCQQGVGGYRFGDVPVISGVIV
jgi:hypothetical protein